MNKWIAFAAWTAVLMPTMQANGLSTLSVSQAITAVAGGYKADPSIRIGYTLDQADEVTVEIRAHLAKADRNSEYLAEPPLVRTLKQGRVEAGRHETVWDGLGEEGKPVVQKYLLKKKDVTDLADDLGRTLKPADLVGEKPIDLFEIRVCAGGKTVATNFRRLSGVVGDSRRVPDGFDGAVSDGQGGYFVISNRRWRGWHFNAQGNLLTTYPARAETWNGNVPVEAKQIFVKNNYVYILSSGNALLRYGLDGNDAPWEAKADYARAARLGITVAKPRPGMTNRIKLDGKEVSYDAAQTDEIARRPGFATNWGGADVDDKFVYLVQNAPRKELQIFDLKGNYLRAVELPPDSYSGARLTKQGQLWVNGPRGIKLIDPQTGAVVKTIRNPKTGSFAGVSMGLDGTLYAWTPGLISRFTDEGEPKPFEQAGGNELDPAKLAPTLGGDVTKIFSVAGDETGNMTVFVTDESKTLGPDRASPRALTFGPTGNYVPNGIPYVEVGSQRPGNVFIEKEAAQLAVFFTSLETKETPGRVEWTATDYEGVKKTGSLDITVVPMAQQVVTVPIGMDNFGYYGWEAKFVAGGEYRGSLVSSAARIRRHDLTPSVDSPFGMVWGRDFYLMGIAGVKKERVGATSWSQSEPIEGVAAPEVDDPTTGVLAMRRAAGRWGVRLSEIFSYGEPWSSKGWLIQIHSFDRFLKYVASMVDLVDDAGVEHFQFWNEPNNFWKLPGAFNREHYAALAKNCWSIVKARSKENMFVCDGDASTFGMMQELADQGAAAYNDALECHYLGTTGVTLDSMKSTNAPETKAGSLSGLIKLRDKYYPGKALLDTEEGTWGNRGQSLASGAQSIPRVYVPLLGAGLDALYWFEFASTSGDVSTSYLLNAKTLPQPAYCSYATMTRMLEGAEVIGRVDLGDPAVFAFLFIRNGQAIVPIWTAGESLIVDLEFGDSSPVTIFDLMDRARTVKGDKVLSLKISQDAQYMTFPCNAWTQGQVERELKRSLKALKLPSEAELQKEIAASAERAAAEAEQMTRLFYLAKAAKLAALLSDKAVSTGHEGQNALAARQGILKKEKANGYLAEARLVLTWAEQLDRMAAKQDAKAGDRMRRVSGWMAEAALRVAEVEQPAFPGVALNAFIGDAGEIAKIRATNVTAPEYPLVDPKFRYEIPKRAGETFELELTVWNYYRHPVEARVSPRLPEGWTTSEKEKSVSLQPGEKARMVYAVTIPADCAEKTYTVGGLGRFENAAFQELHASRIKVVK